MSQLLHVVDAFTNQPFGGNPAAICVLSSSADESWMRAVAREMNLSETAFLHPMEGGYALRWFTPAVEVDLCGHATLASAFTLWETGRLDRAAQARFHTRSGWLTCQREGDWIAMDFPSRAAVPCDPPPGLAAALGCTLRSCGVNGMDYLVEIEDERTLRSLRPQFSALAQLPVRGVIVTSRCEAPGFDFVSRFFAPAAGINEDPVTGSAHCALGPYWQARLGRPNLRAFQASERGGILHLEVRGERILIRGQCVMMSRVEFLAGPK